MALRIEDVSPVLDPTLTVIKLSAAEQSASGRGLTIAASPDGKRVYLGNNAGVWRSNDGGVNWEHMTRPQPSGTSTSVPGALLPLNVYDLAVSAANADIVLAATAYDIRKPGKNGLYRSTDGGRNWALVLPFAITGQIAAAPDDPKVFYVAGGSALAKGIDSGSSWSNLPLPLGAGDQVWHVAVGPGPDASRRIYALGTKLWFSTDGGAHWQVDGSAPRTGSPPADAPGTSTRMLAVHPATPTLIYTTLLSGNQSTVSKGDYSSGTGVWQSLTPTPVPTGTTPSGTDYIATLVADGKLYLFVSDRSHAYVSVGDSPANWVQIDNNMHLDPHAVCFTSDFRLSTAGGARGRIWQVNDGGPYLSADGGATWKGGKGVSTLSLINVAVNPVNGRQPALCFGTGDNGGFFSSNGGRNWVSADYQQGDNDACFSDPKQPSLLYVFAPRGGQNSQLMLYIGSGANPPDGGNGTTQQHPVPGPKPIGGQPLGWNCVSSSTIIGYRPLILTGPAETPRAGGDFICIRYGTDGARVMRSTAIATVSAPADWDSTATAAGAGVKVFRQGPLLPNPATSIVQASGGHATPVFYAGDTNGLWMWKDTMAAWQALVPAAGGPKSAVRFFADPYRPENIYVIDADNVWRSTNGGNTWAIDAALQAALTENGAFPMSITASATPSEAILQDLIFVADNPNGRIAAGPAGIFATSDGTNWETVALSSAANTRIMSLFLDTVSDASSRTLYVATPFRGLVKVTENSASGVFASMGLLTASLLGFAVFRTSPPFSEPFVASADPAHPDTTKPEGKLQKALTDAITAKAQESDHHQILKARDPKSADFLDVFPIAFTIADVTGSRPYPVAHYNGDEVDFVGSEAKTAVLFAALELRTMVRRYANDLGITQRSVLLDALKLLEPKILNAVPLIKDAKDVQGRKLRVQDVQRLPQYEKIFEIDDSGPTLKINFKGSVSAETDPKKVKRQYDFGQSLYDMIVNSGDDTAQNCIDAIGYAFLNGALEAGGFFERPTPSDPLTFRGIWVGGNYNLETIRGEMSINDGPAQFGGTSHQFARLLALIRAGTFADPDDPNGDLAWTLLNKAQHGSFPPLLASNFGSGFKYVLNKLGWGPLGRSLASINWVASEVALIQKVKPDGTVGNSYVVALQNLEMINKKNSVEVVTKGGHKLYLQPDVAEIITNAVAAYES